MEVEQKMDSGDILQKQVPLTAEPGDNFRAMNLQNHHTGWKLYYFFELLMSKYGIN